MNVTLNAREETIARLAREGMLDHEIAELFRRAQSAQNFAVVLCNRNVTEREQKRDDTNTKALLLLVEGHVSERTGKPWRVEVTGDPRGYVVKVKLPSGASNNWGGEAWGIPTKG